MNNPNPDYKTILLVEDDETVRSLLHCMLETNGYSVIPAVDGEEGVAKYKDQQNEVDLVLMDVVMPKKDGATAYREITELNPDAKILMMSGYSASSLDSIKNLNFISKPMMSDKLLSTIENLLAVPA